MNKVLKLLLVHKFLSNFVLIFPLYAIMFSERGNLSTSEVAWLFAVWSAAALFFEIPTGMLADKISRKACIVFASIFESLTYICWLFVPSFWGYAIGFVLWGLGFALNSGAYQAYVYDELASNGNQKRYLHFMSQVGAARYSGMLSAYVLTVILSIGRVDYELLLTCSMAAALFTAVIATMLPRAKAVHTEKPDNVFRIMKSVSGALVRNKVLLRISVALGIIMMFKAWFEEYIPLVNKQAGVSTEGIPLVLILSLMVGVALYHAPRWLARRRIMTQFGLVAFAAAVLAVAILSSQLWIVIPASIVFMKLCIWSETVRDADLQELLQSKSRATATSIVSFCSEALTILLYGSIALITLVLSFAWTIGLVLSLAIVIMFILGRSYPKSFSQENIRYNDR